MINVTDPERATQVRVIELLHDRLGYRFLGSLEEGKNTCLRKDDLIVALSTRLGYTKKLATAAYQKLKESSTISGYDLYAANRDTYELLKYGAKITEEDGKIKTVHFVDWENPENNDFAVAEEVTVKYTGRLERRPDVVLYVNGIAIAVLELKKSAVSVGDGIRQCISAQRGVFIDGFFSTIQFCLAGNDSEGLRYGTTKTPEKYYLEWKADGYDGFQDERDPIDAAIEAEAVLQTSPLDKALVRMFTKARVLDLIENFVIFDGGIKKLCRYNQFYGIKRAQNRLKKHQGGIVWHTQGSGKSLTMVWLSKWILSHNPDGRILVVTDREELDDQIEKLYKGVGEMVARTKSGKDLLNRLNSLDDRIVCSLVHKFARRVKNEEGEGATEEDLNKYVEDLKASLPAGFAPKGQIVVFVDECHRTHSGKLHEAMKTILPDAVLIGFTGTPLLRRDKKTSLEVFGGYIHTYKFKEGVKDGIVLDLRYEARDIPQEISSQERIDAWFDTKTAALTDRAKARLKEKWGTMQQVYSSKGRLARIVSDIIFDFSIKPRLKESGRGTAMLVAEDVYTACKFYELFVSQGFTKCAIITSYRPHPGELRTDTSDEEERTQAIVKYEIYRKMVGLEDSDVGDNLIKKVEAFETEAKRKFKDEPGEMKLLIVVNKLLTGFDAPSCTYLYIDKHLEDHGLFQAICRVNRLDGEEKDFGYIVDYKQLFGSIAEALETYSNSGAFAGYDPEDVDGLVKGIAADSLRDFTVTLEALEREVDGVSAPKDLEAHLVYFCGSQGARLNAEEKAKLLRMREKLYKETNKLLRAWAELKPRLSEAGVTETDAKRYESRVTFFTNLKMDVGLRSGDLLDLKMYEADMRHLIDNYIDAFDSKKLSDIDDFTLLDFIEKQDEEAKSKDKTDESAAETIENNFSVELVQKQLENPKYFERMSAILEMIIRERKEETLKYQALLDKYKEMARILRHPENDPHYPESIRARAALRSLFDNCGEDEALAIKLDEAVTTSKEIGFRDDPIKQRRIQKAIYGALADYIGDPDERRKKVEEFYNLVVQQKEY